MNDNCIWGGENCKFDCQDESLLTENNFCAANLRQIPITVVHGKIESGCSLQYILALLLFSFNG